MFPASFRLGLQQKNPCIVFIQLCVNWQSAPHSFNQLAAPHSSNYASTGGQHRIHSTSGQHHSHPATWQPVVSTAFFQPAVSTTFTQLCINQWSSTTVIQTAVSTALIQRHSCCQSITHKEPVTSSSWQQSSVKSTQGALWTNTIFPQSFHPQLTPQPATPTHGITISTLLNQLTTHRHAVSPSPHSSTS